MLHSMSKKSKFVSLQLTRSEVKNLVPSWDSEHFEFVGKTGDLLYRYEYRMDPGYFFDCVLV